MKIKIEGSDLFIDDTHADYIKVMEMYGATHDVTPVIGTQPDLRRLKSNESVVWGDGKTFHFKLTKR
jgi:hypothetical protein